MPFLIAAVVLLGLLAVLNLLLTLALIRRLKSDEAASGHGGHGGNASPPVVLGPGARPADVKALTTADESVSTETLTGVVGFFSANCDPCHALAPRLAEYGRAVGREKVLAVVSGEDPELVGLLAGSVRVVVEDFQGPVSTAFKNEWTPALYLLADDQRVVATGGRLEDLPLPSLA
ncbi:TlpA family protein disulfide reductase [Actinomadura roseirufa]|uniref:TlpA family protein disulfide reductase n=1 Tax=Actinomadura roseirufa TaxID=2094049 RepID=UPI0010410C3F|nr:TlpA family protein disulfide reductase [Actinomadura roseirufa]